MRIRAAALLLAGLAAAVLPFALGHQGERLLASAFEQGLRGIAEWPRARENRVEAVSDSVRVVDGDTLALGELRFRLHGIDAPELRQECREGERQVPCGEMARQQLERLLRGAPRLSCDLMERDHYGRSVARCTRSDGVEVNRAMVRQGWALPYLAYGGRIYAADLRRARGDRLGLHHMSYEVPAAYRRRLREE
jgi:endonuclease YncB( thermonuclease family)